MNDLRKDIGTRARLEEIQEDYRERAAANRKLIREIGDAYKKFSRRTMRVILALGLGWAALGGLNIYLLGQNSDRASDIQRQRYSSVFQSCNGQNHRHDKTIKKLNQLVESQTDPAEKARSEKNLHGTVALIDALVPKQDCVALATRAVHPPRHPHKAAR